MQYVLPPDHEGDRRQERTRKEAIDVVRRGWCPCHQAKTTDDTEHRFKRMNAEKYDGEKVLKIAACFLGFLHGAILACQEMYQNFVMIEFQPGGTCWEIGTQRQWRLRSMRDAQEPSRILELCIRNDSRLEFLPIDHRRVEPR